MVDEKNSKIDSRLYNSEVQQRKSILIIKKATKITPKQEDSKIEPEKNSVYRNTHKTSLKYTIDSEDDMFNYTKTMTGAATNFNAQTKQMTADEISYLESFKRSPDKSELYTISQTIDNNSGQFQNTDFNGLKRITINLNESKQGNDEVDMKSNISMNQYKFKRTKFLPDNAKNDKNCDTLKKDIKNNIDAINAKFQIDESSDCFLNVESSMHSERDTQIHSRASLGNLKNNDSCPNFKEKYLDSKDMVNFDLTEHFCDNPQINKIIDSGKKTFTSDDKKTFTSDGKKTFTSDGKKTFVSDDREDDAFKVTINVRPEELKGIKQDDPVYFVSDFAQ